MADERAHRFPGLEPSEFDADPLAQFRLWHERAREAGVREPDAMALATTDVDGRPSARMVLLRGVEAGGLRFFTNYASRKGLELAANARAALLFYWPELDRQVRIEGTVERLSAETSDDYFRTRPRESQIAAWASPQSRPLVDRSALERRYIELDTQHRGREVPRPPHWGGFVLRPDHFEFWQGRPHRLHDRLCYRSQQGGGWRLERLAP